MEIKVLESGKKRLVFELKETDDETARKEYYQSVEEALKLILPAYFKSLDKLQLDTSFTKRHDKKTKELVQLMYENDFAIDMGKIIFKEHFEKYWLDGFWNVEVELKD